MAQIHKNENEQESRTAEYPRVPLSEAIECAFSLPPTVGVMILGEPGIGKTTSVLKRAFEEASRLDKQVVDVSELVTKPKGEVDKVVAEVRKNPEKFYIISFIKIGSSHPEELTPIPVKVSVVDPFTKKVSTRYADAVFGLSLELISIPGVYGCLILDDVTNVVEPQKKDFIAAVYGERRLPGTHPKYISKNVRVIGTGNLPEHSELARVLPEIMVGRAWQVVVKPDTLESWYQIMKEKYKSVSHIVDEVYAFLKRYPNYAQNLKLLKEMPRVGPVLRSWEAFIVTMANLWDIYERNVRAGMIEHAVGILAGSVGPEAAYQFFVYHSKKVPSVEEALSNPHVISSEIAKDLDIAFRFVVQIAHRLEKILTDENVSKETVRVPLGKGLFHEISLGDPQAYIVLLHEVMEHTTSDIIAFAGSMMSRKATEKFKTLVREALATRVSSNDPPEVATWKQKVKRAGEAIASFLIHMGITDIMIRG